MSRNETCHYCKGHRLLNDGNGEYNCPECGGSGYYQDCPNCGGDGVVYISTDSSARETCSYCRGNGYIR